MPDGAHFERHFGEAPALSHNTLVRIQRSLLGDDTVVSARSVQVFCEILARGLEPQKMTWFERRPSDPATWPSSRRAATLLGYLYAVSQERDDPPSYTLRVAVEFVDEDAALARGTPRDALVHAPRLLLDKDVVGIEHGHAYRLADTMLYLGAAQQAEAGHLLVRHGIDPGPFDAMRAPPYAHGMFQERFFAHLLAIGGNTTGAAFVGDDPGGAHEESLTRQIRAWRARDGEWNMSRGNLERMIGAGLPASLRADDGVELWTAILWDQYDALLSMRTVFESSELDDVRLTALLERFADRVARHRAVLDTWVPRPAFEDQLPLPFGLFERRLPLLPLPGPCADLVSGHGESGFGGGGHACVLR